MRNIVYIRNEKYRLYLISIFIYFTIKYIIIYNIYQLVTYIQAASPACTELETVVLDWVGKHMLQKLETWVHSTKQNPHNETADMWLDC